MKDEILTFSPTGSIDSDLVAGSECVSPASMEPGALAGIGPINPQEPLLRKLKLQWSPALWPGLGPLVAIPYTAGVLE